MAESKKVEDQEKKILDLQQNEDLLKQKKAELDRLRENFQKDIEKEAELQKMVDMEATNDENALQMEQYLTTYIDYGNWPVWKIDAHFKIFEKLKAREEHQRVVLSKILDKQLRKNLRDGSHTFEKIREYLNSREAKNKYHNEKAHKQMFLWQNEQGKQPDEYLLEAIVKLNLKDSIINKSFQLAESLLYEGLKARHAQDFQGADSYFSTALKMIPDPASGQADQTQENSRRFLRAQLQVNRILVLSIDKKHFAEIIQLGDAWKEEDWIDDKTYFEIFGNVEDIVMIKKFFWDQATARYEIFGTACQQVKRFQQAANLLEEMILFLDRNEHWYQEQGDGKKQKLQGTLNSMYEQKRASKGKPADNEKKEAVSTCCEIF